MFLTSWNKVRWVTIMMQEKKAIEETGEQFVEISEKRCLRGAYA